MTNLFELYSCSVVAIIYYWRNPSELVTRASFDVVRSPAPDVVDYEHRTKSETYVSLLHWLTTDYRERLSIPKFPSDC